MDVVGRKVENRKYIYTNNFDTIAAVEIVENKVPFHLTLEFQPMPVEFPSLKYSQ